MACCVLAAFILAQCVATVRRWGMFWGIVRIPDGENAATLFGKMRAYLGSTRARYIVAAVVAVEFCALLGWVTLEHGQHIARFADVAWSRLHGDRVIYAGLCTVNGQQSTRIVLHDAARP